MKDVEQHRHVIETTKYRILDCIYEVGESELKHCPLNTFITKKFLQMPIFIVLTNLTDKSYLPVASLVGYGRQWSFNGFTIALEGLLPIDNALHERMTDVLHRQRHSTMAVDYRIKSHHRCATAWHSRNSAERVLIVAGRFHAFD